ncbi:hypothetical protein Cob_v001444 [Colletotrichum orbiculare MAFF 240422]|uniref:Uncharacterized protein n=1 Tax=Colletotrichum orbiculare (strain 104-T / ATCC 96160 / CBS 514.97 / LARS 414 / MAFF 240422) TaxID=1213857 RepID=A0A484GAA7_COLOR|nr:hypothetical protein Cob_v001444 [Colletotrichum orbiculare MAFF 240422]
MHLKSRAFRVEQARTLPLTSKYRVMAPIARRVTSEKPHGEVEEGWLTENHLLEFQHESCFEQYVIFLPSMPDLFDSKKMAYKFSRNFVEGLRKKFKIDRFFLSKFAHGSNGLFCNQYESIKAYGCRLLVKELEQIEDYHNLEDTRREIYYKAMVRRKHRVTRLDIDELPAKELEKQRTDRLTTCFNMHEISRHLIHSQETLNAAETMFMAILDSQKWKGTMATEILRFCHEFLINLKLRARAFVERLNNEIAHELHVNNLDQLEKVEKLHQENRRDGKEVAELNKLVGYASILFLPGTFFSL